MSTKEVIKTLGGYEEAAAKCGIKSSAVRKWLVNGIPSKHWAKIVTLTGISFETLAGMAG